MQTLYDIPALIKEAVLKQVPDAKLYLFGSRVTGNVHKESDWDVLVLVPGDRLDLKTERSITSPLYDIEFDTVN